MLALVAFTSFAVLAPTIVTAAVLPRELVSAPYLAIRADACGQSEGICKTQIAEGACTFEETAGGRTCTVKTCHSVSRTFGNLAASRPNNTLVTGMVPNL